ncbi:MAG: hypothetical protein MUD08_11070 [Cytophagales bacterium]|jgi:hypothetical protein|nr:hypothetical protein [Cytophagales bacterium]
MTTPHNLNLQRIKAVAQALRPLSQEVVFVGGATVALYCDLQQIPEIRPTDDVDVVVELATYGSYGELDAKLRAIGFRNDVMSGVICRYQVQGITVDVMPTVPDALGFSNRRYPDGFRQAISVPVDENLAVKIFSVPFLLRQSGKRARAGAGTTCAGVLILKT